MSAPRTAPEELRRAPTAAAPAPGGPTSARPEGAPPAPDAADPAPDPAPDLAVDPAADPVTDPAADPAGDVVRWAVFSCVLVPLVLLWYGTSLAGTAGTALGLAAVTAVCRLLLRRAERGVTAERGAAEKYGSWDAGQADGAAGGPTGRTGPPGREGDRPGGTRAGGGVQYPSD
ncbi:hypothetical protein ACIQNG_06565 [Streptomyces sp. NPDC091377]|uniref:hypothetical protein n=1 Tax=Streptomyces sp. NPDC091377 TaxID=3365995 RepID=UPI0038089DAD